MNFTENKNFVISIPTADKRRNHIIEQFGRQNIPFEFFDAFTPSPELDSLIQWNLPQLDETTFTNGEKACFMSHLELWKKCIDEDLPYINIFEDDIYLGENADHFLSQDKWLVQRFDLSSKFIIHLETFLMPIKAKSSQITSYHNREFLLLRSVHFGAAAYTLSQPMAKYLLGMVPRLSGKKFQPLDLLLFDNLLNSKKISVYQLAPALCVQELQLMNKSTLESQLEVERKQNHICIQSKKTLWEKLQREVYRFKRRIINKTCSPIKFK